MEFPIVHPMPAIEPKTLRFGNFSLDLARCSLRRGVEEIQLRPKALDVLRYLAENPGRLVSKDELLKVVWAGVVVTDDSLVQCVKNIRDAVNDSEQRIIKTVPRRGYLFAAEVSSSAPVKEPDIAPAVQRGSPWRAKLWLAAMGALIALAALDGRQLIDDSRAPGRTVADINRTNGRSETAAQRQSIAVLPLVSLADPPRDDYFADALTEDIISALGRFPEILARSRNAVSP